MDMVYANFKQSTQRFYVKFERIIRNCLQTAFQTTVKDLGLEKLTEPYECLK